MYLFYDIASFNTNDKILFLFKDILLKKRFIIYFLRFSQIWWSKVVNSCFNKTLTRATIVLIKKLNIKYIYFQTAASFP